MTELLQSAWKASSKPFHHETVCPEDLVPLCKLHPFIKSIFGHIQMYYPDARFLAFDDWHAHDGFIASSSPIKLAEVAVHLKTPDSLYQWRQGDFAVYRAFYPETLDFLLRIHVLEKDEDPQEYPGIWGFVSFSGYGFDLSEIKKRALDFDGLKLKQQNSKDYFDSISAG